MFRAPRKLYLRDQQLSHSTLQRSFLKRRAVSKYKYLRLRLCNTGIVTIFFLNSVSCQIQSSSLDCDFIFPAECQSSLQDASIIPEICIQADSPVVPPFTPSCLDTYVPRMLSADRIPGFPYPLQSMREMPSFLLFASLRCSASASPFLWPLPS